MDKNIILNKIAYLKENLLKIEKRIEKYEKESNFEEKETLELAITKLIEELVETAIKINNILLEENNSYGGTYSSTFTKLGQFYSIDNNLLLKLAKTTSIRNKIAHEYEIENKINLIEKYKNFIPLYEKYIQFILSIIKKSNN